MSSNNKHQKPLVQKRDNYLVSEQFCFHRHYSDISGTYGAYAYYKDHKKTPKELYGSNTPIAIDTNILLNLYKISFKEREEFLKFIEKNAYRIIIPAQVQQEYMYHRINHIQAFQRTLKELEPQTRTILDSLKKSYKTASEQLKQLGNRKIVSNDMPNVMEQIKNVQQFIQQHKFSDDYINELTNLFSPLLENLKKGVDDSMKQAVYELEDPVLSSLSKAQIQKPLSQFEMDFLNSKYHQLLEEYNEHKSQLSEITLFTFPGCGDRFKEKDGLDPCGDFYIYHELLSYMRRTNQDVVLLTNDVTKSDWVGADRKPFGHYIVDTYMNTGHMLYIFNARDFTPLTFEAVAESSEEGRDDDVSPEILPVDANADETETTGADVMNMNHTIESDESSLESNDIINNTQDSNVGEQDYSYLRDVTEERFMQELEAAEIWAKDFGDGCLRQDFFIFTVLGHKNFKYSSSRKMLDKLKNEGLIRVVEKEEEDKKYKCLEKVR